MLKRAGNELHLAVCSGIQYPLMVSYVTSNSSDGFDVNKFSFPLGFLGDGFDLFGRWYVNSRSNYQRYCSP